jgi:hypothetical protein
MDEQAVIVDERAVSFDLPHHPTHLASSETPDRGAEALIKEARRRARRRHAIVISVVLLLVAGLVTLLLPTAGSKVPNGAKRAATSPRIPARGLRISTVRFPGPFVPQQVVSEGGRIWLLGSTNPSRYTDCALEEVNPSTLTAETFPLPQCADDIAPGNGQLFLLTDTFVPGTAATRELRIEVFDTSRHRATVLAPVDLTMIGSAIAHQALAYGDGVLWLYGHNGTGGTTVVQISPSTGAVLASTSAVPVIGGVFPSVVANAGGLWLAGGPAGSPYIELIRPGATTPTEIDVGPSSQTSIPWLAGIGNLLWADVEAVGGGPTPTVAFHLLAFDTSGKQTISSPVEQTGYFPVVPTSNSELWTVRATCNGPQELVAVSGRTGVSHVATNLKSPINPCLYGANGSQLASVGRSVFVLDPTDAGGSSVLFRVEVPQT